MAVSAFKSSSRRGQPFNSSDKQTKQDSTKPKAAPRRSKSVSAFSRTAPSEISSNDFLIKRDNPLFSTTNDQDQTTTSKPAASVEDEDATRRGRSVSRNAKPSGIGRSLSRVDTGRRARSVSRGPLLRTQSESGTLTGSEAEEKTIKAVCEQMETFRGDNMKNDASATSIYETVRSEVRRAISDIQNDLRSAMGRSNTGPLATASVTDISPDFVSPAAVELVLDIRREYAKKLEQSQERAARLRADLDVEEHRGLELTRILKEVLPHPNTPNVQKSCPGRKCSIERRKMSKRLTDEAMAYFDECVSLSTFDSSDFSSQEDPLCNSLGVASAAVASVSLPPASSSMSASYSPDDKQDCWFTRSQDALELTASSSSKEHTRDQVGLFRTEKVRGRRFSFECRPSETFDLQQNILTYVRNFEKDTDEVNLNPKITTSNHYDLDDYNLQVSTQSLLFDRVFLKNRLESGSLLLCSGGIAISSSPFPPII